MKDDHIAKTISVYNKKAVEYDKQAQTHIPIFERDKFVTLIPKGGNILDVGCGSGRDSKFFIEKGFKAVGIDLSFELLNIAMEKVPEGSFYQQDMRDIRFPPEVFDGIWDCAAMLHLKKNELPKVLMKLYFILKPKGVVCSLLKEGSGEVYKEESSVPGESRFYAFYTLNELNQVYRDSGFEIIESYVYNDSDRNKDTRSIRWIACFARKV